MTGFRVASGAEVARAGFLRVEELQVEGPDGSRLSRHVVRHPGAVMVVPIETDGRVVFVRQYRAAPDRELLEIPAGKRDVDGERPESTAARELEEEIGVRAGRLVPLAEFFLSPGFCDEYAHLFVALELAGAGGPRPQGPEERAMTIERHPLASVDDLVARREIVDAKTIIGLTLARRFLAGEYPGLV